MISVVIPVINHLPLTKQLFYGMYNNTFLPKEVILIDNGSSDPYKTFCNYFIQEQEYRFDIKYFRNSKNIGVNPSWNFGISQSLGKYISILNNDIIITNSFFRKIVDVFETYEDVGIVIPNTIDDALDLEDTNDKVQVKKAKVREGWAFTIRRDMMNKIPPIPDILNKNFGDDYLFYFTSKLGYKIVRMTNNYINHIGSVTQRDIKKRHRPDKGIERENWNKIKSDIDKHLGECA